MKPPVGLHAMFDYFRNPLIMRYLPGKTDFKMNPFMDGQSKLVAEIGIEEQYYTQHVNLWLQLKNRHLQDDFYRFCSYKRSRTSLLILIILCAISMVPATGILMRDIRGDNILPGNNQNLQARIYSHLSWINCLLSVLFGVIMLIITRHQLSQLLRKSQPSD